MNNDKRIRIAYIGFVWHAFFLALTMSMLDLNTVFPQLVSELTQSKSLFGLLYSIMLGVPLVFNLLFSYYLKTKRRKKPFLMLGIYLRAFSFLGMAVLTYFFGKDNPRLVFGSFFLWILLFSLSGGLAGLSYSVITAKTIPAPRRAKLYVVKQLFSSVAAFVGGLAVGRIFSQSGLDYPANYTVSLSIGFVGLLVASIGFWIIHEPDPEYTDEQKETFRAHMKRVPQIIKEDLNFRRFIIVENMASFSIMAMPFYMIFASEVLHVDGSYLGRYLIYQVSGTVFSNILWWLVAKKFGSKVLVRSCIIIGGIIPVLAIGLSFLGPDFFAIVFLLLGFVISGRRAGFEPLLLELAPEHVRTEYLGIRGTLNIFTIILPLLGGVFIETLGYYATFGIVSAVMIAASTLLRTQKEPVVARCIGENNQSNHEE